MTILTLKTIGRYDTVVYYKLGKDENASIVQIYVIYIIAPIFSIIALKP